MEHLLFAGYLLLFAWIVTKVKFFTNSGLNNSQLIIIFLLKVMAGILYGWVGIYYGITAQMVDTWSFHYRGLQEYKLLQTNPSEYFSNLLNNPFEGGYLKFLSGHDSFWNELKTKSIIKMLSVFDILSFGNYYVNIIFYSFITLFGPVGIYRIMKDVFSGKNTQVAISAFLIPSFLYWNSGIHKEGIIFTGLILIIYNLYFALAENKLKPKRFLLILLGLVLITLLRNFYLLLISPAIIAWLLATRFPKRALGIFVTIYLISGILFFTAKYINPALDFPSSVVSKQKEFMEMYGGSMVPVKELKPTAIDFIKTIPQALSLSTLRPYPRRCTTCFLTGRSHRN
ncbi:MAG: hypothetical protein WDO19_24095 [Bacteroidota bacterium]